MQKGQKERARGKFLFSAGGGKYNGGGGFWTDVYKTVFTLSLL
jgi:hypothetical protein